ncbi:MAG TPA: ABC transporter permease [bacterium]|nr:ABC transporter permease [bacterium]
MSTRSLPLRWGRVVISGLIGIAVWQFFAAAVVRNALFLPAPGEVLKASIEVVRSGELLDNLKVSLSYFAVGSALGFAAGVLLGVVLGASPRAAEYIDPWVSAAYTAPLVALTPLLIIWFGIGLWSKTIIIALLVVFPVTIGTVAGIRSTDRSLLEVATSMGAGRLDILRKVMVPWSLSFILSGARIGVGRGVIGIFVAELFGGASKGVGLMIQNAASVFNTPLLFVGIMVLALMGVVVTSLIRQLERRMAPWRTQSVV